MALGHRRLSIIDLSAAGHQPMVSASGRYVIVFNGEIYNHLDLRNDLQGIAWRGHSATETLLAAVEAWGLPRTLARSVGMFAFALWDQHDRVLTLAHDRLGEKPLYYGWQRGVLLFGSELKALKAHPAFVGDIDRDALALYVRHKAIPAPHSIYKDIHKLTPGCYLQVGAKECAARSPRVVAYWSARAVAETGQRTLFAGTDDDALDQLERLLGQSIAGQMLADVPLGAFLSGCQARRGSRTPVDRPGQWVSYGDLDHSLHEAVAGCDVVVHFAGHAHVPETPAGIEQAHRTNVMGTTELATACARSGVQRFVFISSALVLDGGRDPEGRIGDDCPRHPLTAYAQSKAEAEDRLLHVCEAAGMEWVVIRPPMVYGPQSPGNFQRLVGLVRSGVPIPLGRATAKRSFVFVDNLISAIQVAMVSPMARNETFVVGDDEVTSTAELLYMIGMQLGRPVRLLDLPLTLLQLAGSCVGRRADIDRMLKPLYVDASRIKRKLEWQPPFRLVEGVARSVG